MNNKNTKYLNINITFHTIVLNQVVIIKKTSMNDIVAVNKVAM